MARGVFSGVVVGGGLVKRFGERGGKGPGSGARRPGFKSSFVAMCLCESYMPLKLLEREAIPLPMGF